MEAESVNDYQERVRLDRKIVEDYHKMIAKNHKPFIPKEEKEEFVLRVNLQELRAIRWAFKETINDLAHGICNKSIEKKYGINEETLIAVSGELEKYHLG